MRNYSDDTILWQAFLKGDNLAQADVFNRYFQPATLFAERFTGQLEPAEDIVSEVMVKIWTRRRDFPALENAKAFLYQSVRNAGINYIKAEKRHLAAHHKIAYLLNQDTESAGALEREILRVEVLKEIYEEIEQLPDQCKDIFKQLFLRERTPQEVAKDLGLSVQTIYSQKARAISLLRASLLKKHRLEALLLFLFLVEKW